MTLSKCAIGNLINRYKAVLKKCNLMNVFGTLAVTGMLLAGSVGVAGAADHTIIAGATDFTGFTAGENLITATDTATVVLGAAIETTGTATYGLASSQNPALSITFNVEGMKTGAVTIQGTSGSGSTVVLNDTFTYTANGTTTIGVDSLLNVKGTYVSTGLTTINSTSAITGLLLTGIAATPGDDGRAVFNGNISITGSGSGIAGSGGTGGKIIGNVTVADSKAGGIVTTNGALEITGNLDLADSGGMTLSANALTVGGSLKGSGSHAVSGGILNINESLMESGVLTVSGGGELSYIDEDGKYQAVTISDTTNQRKNTVSVVGGKLKAGVVTLGAATQAATSDYTIEADSLKQASNGVLTIGTVDADKKTGITIRSVAGDTGIFFMAGAAADTITITGRGGATSGGTLQLGTLIPTMAGGSTSIDADKYALVETDRNVVLAGVATGAANLNASYGKFQVGDVSVGADAITANVYGNIAVDNHGTLTVGDITVTGRKAGGSNDATLGINVIGAGSKLVTGAILLKGTASSGSGLLTIAGDGSSAGVEAVSVKLTSATDALTINTAGKLLINKAYSVSDFEKGLVNVENGSLAFGGSGASTLKDSVLAAAATSGKIALATNGVLDFQSGLILSSITNVTTAININGPLGTIKTTTLATNGTDATGQTVGQATGTLTIVGTDTGTGVFTNVSNINMSNADASNAVALNLGDSSVYGGLSDDLKETYGGTSTTNLKTSATGAAAVSINVNAGTWNLGNIEVAGSGGAKNGSLTVAGTANLTVDKLDIKADGFAKIDGNLTIGDNTSATANLATAVVGLTGGSGVATGLEIASGGSLTINEIGVYDMENTQIAAGVKQILFTDGSNLKIHAAADRSLTQLKTIFDAVKVSGSDGYISLSDPSKLVITAAEKNTATNPNSPFAGTVKSTAANGTNIDFTTQTANTDKVGATLTSLSATTTTGGYKATGIVIEDATNTATASTFTGIVTIDDNTTLSGTDGSLVQVVNKLDGKVTVESKDIKLTVGGGKSLTIGINTKKSTAALSDITLAADGTDKTTLSANGAVGSAFTVGDITVANNGEGAVGVAEGNSLITGNIGVSGTAVGTLTADGDLTAKGDVFVSSLSFDASKASLNVDGTLTTTTALTLGTAETAVGAADAVTGVTVMAGEVNVGTAAINIIEGSSLTTGKLTTTGDITVGSQASGSTGILNVAELSAVGSTIFADPAYKDGVKQDAAKVVIGKFTASPKAIDSVLVAGQLSQFIVGQVAGSASGSTVNLSEDWIDTRMTDARLVWGNPDASKANIVNAAFGINSRMTIASGGSVDVDGSFTSNTSAVVAGNARFADDSLFVVDVTEFRNSSGDALVAGNGAALTVKAGSATLTVEDGAKLLLSNVKNKDVVEVADATTLTFVTQDAWGNEAGTEPSDTIYFDNAFMTGEGKVVGNTYTVTVGQNSAASVMPALSSGLAGLMDAAITANIVSPTSPSAAGRFFDAISKVANKTEGAALGDSAVKLGQAGAIGANIGSIGSASAANAGVRTELGSSFVADSGVINYDGEFAQVSGVSSGQGMKTGLGLWVMPMYQNHSAHGFESDNFEYGYDSSFYGASIGADFTTPNNFRIGAMFNIGAGNSDSNGDFADTTNDFDYMGFGVYAGYHFNNIGLSADVGYTNTINEMEQDNLGGKIKGNTSAQLLTAGLRAEYKLVTDAIDLIPYVGIRLNSINIGSYDSKQNGAVLFENESMHTTNVQFPLGLTLGKSIVTSDGWNFAPSLSAGVLFTTGDLKVEQDVKIPGIGSSQSMNSDIADAVTFQGGLGVAFGKDNFSMALDYNLNASEHVTSHGIFATLRYEF